MKLLDIHEPGQTPLPHENAAAVGIDLGTTYSVVAVATADTREVVHNIHGHALVPSVVYYGDKIEVGYSARAHLEHGDKGAIASVKRLMGRGIDDIRPFMGNLPYDVAPGTGGMVRLKAGGREVTPVEVSAEILKELKRIAEQALGKDVKQAVITVPAYFDDAARAATKDAARLAGLEVLRLVNEPTAAALAYGLDKGIEGIYAIFDLGGGTFDISLLKLQEGVFQVLSTGGDTQLGGDDFDQALAADVVSEMELAETNMTAEDIAVIVSLARTAKHTLTDAQNAKVAYKGKEVTVSRYDFEELIIPYVDKALSVCEQALLDAKLSIGDVKGVVMVGGSTRVPLVIRKVQEFFNRAPLNDVNPDEVVAIGAAIQAHGLTEGSDNLLLDVIPLSLCLETMGGISEKIIERNTPIPVSVAQEFTTYKDGQNGMQMHILQGEREMAADNRSLARFELSGIPILPAGIARIQVKFTVDADGLLTVSAGEATTGVQQSIHVKPSYGLEYEEIEKMLLASMENARKDITNRLLAEARVEAGRAIAELESVLSRDKDLLSESELKQIERQMQVVRNAAEGDDRDYMDAEVQELGRIAQNFAERRMDKAVGSALKGAHIDKVELKNHA